MTVFRALTLAALAIALGHVAVAQTAAERREKLKNMIPRHEGYLGALAPENLKKERPAPPFDLTGTWFVDLSDGFANFRFGPPYPEFIGQAKADFEEGQRMSAQRLPYRDAIGQCFPAGIPMIMTRVWPIAMVQLPTVIMMVSNFNNSFRQIFIDGRDYSNPDTIIYTYNGESIGRWEKDTLVVDTRYIETYNHYIDTGIDLRGVPHAGAPALARERRGPRDRAHHDGPRQLGRRVAQHQTLAARRPHRHR
jgi:hypothetical protein